MVDVKDEISQRLLGVAQRRVTVGDSAYATENWSSSSKELVHQMMQRSRSESFAVGRRPKQIKHLRMDIYGESFTECQKCTGLQEKFVKDKKKYFLEVEHLRRGITKCLDHLAATMTTGAFAALKTSLQLDVHYFSGPDGEENSQEGQQEKEAKPTPTSLGLQAKQKELDHLQELVSKLEDEISALEKENARLQKEMTLAEVATRRAANVKTLHAQCQVDSGTFPSQPGRPPGGGSGEGGAAAGGPWNNASYGGQHDGSYPPHAYGVPSGTGGGGAGPAVPGGAGHYSAMGTGSVGPTGLGPHGDPVTKGGSNSGSISIDSSHLAEMERLKQELERTKRNLRGAERELRQRKDNGDGTEEGQSGGDDGAEGAPDSTQEASVVRKHRGSAAQGSSSTGGKRGSQSTGDSGGSGASASGTISSSGSGKSHRAKDKSGATSGNAIGAAGLAGGRRAHGTEASADVDSREGAADGEQDATPLGARVAPETADKCVGGGPGPGLSEEPLRCRGKPILPPKEMNKAGICFARRLRSQPTIIGLSASVSSLEGLMDTLDASASPGKGVASSELRAANKTWPGFGAAAPGASATIGGGITAVNSASGAFGNSSLTSPLAALSSTSPLDCSAEPYLMHVWEHKRPQPKAKVEEELARLGAMTPLAPMPVSHLPMKQK